MATSTSGFLFMNNQLVWHPTIVRPDGSSIGVGEFWITESPNETDRTINAFLKSIEVNGADLHATLSRELANLRLEASHLSDLLRQSRSIREATDNGARLKRVILLLRILESHYASLSKRTGTEGD